MLQAKNRQNKELKQRRSQFVPEPQKLSDSIDDLLATARRQNDLQGQNEGEFPVLANGNFEKNDIRRFCRVCNVELPGLAQYQVFDRKWKSLPSHF